MENGTKGPADEAVWETPRNPCRSYAIMPASSIRYSSSWFRLTFFLLLCCTARRLASIFLHYSSSILFRLSVIIIFPIVFKGWGIKYQGSIFSPLYFYMFSASCYHYFRYKAQGRLYEAVFYSYYLYKRPFSTAFTYYR